MLQLGANICINIYLALHRVDIETLSACTCTYTDVHVHMGPVVVGATTTCS